MLFCANQSQHLAAFNNRFIPSLIKSFRLQLFISKQLFCSVGSFCSPVQKAEIILSRHSMSGATIETVLAIFPCLLSTLVH